MKKTFFICACTLALLCLLAALLYGALVLPAVFGYAPVRIPADTLQQIYPPHALTYLQTENAPALGTVAVYDGAQNDDLQPWYVPCGGAYAALAQRHWYWAAGVFAAAVILTLCLWPRGRKKQDENPYGLRHARLPQ